MCGAGFFAPTGCPVYEERVRRAAIYAKRGSAGLACMQGESPQGCHVCGKRVRRALESQEKRIMKRRKVIRVLLVVCLLAVTATVGIPAVYGYFTARKSLINKVAPGGNKIRIAETFTPPQAIEPGDVIRKDVKIQNGGPSPCFVRVKAVFSDSAMKDYCTVDRNSTDFVYDESDGYYYYKRALDYDKENQRGQMTESLFTTIAIDEGMPREKLKSFDVIVYAESYQAEEGTEYRKAWEQYRKNKGREDG